MEQTEESDCDVLKKILTEDELTQLSETVANKLRNYFNENFEEFITAKAVFQHTRQSLEKKLEKLQKDFKERELDLEEHKGKLELAENHVNELQSKLDEAKNEIYKLQENVKRLQKETSEFRRQRDAAVDERDTLQMQAERRDHEVERLHTEITSLSSQLQAAVTAKCQAIAEAEEIRSREMNLEYKEKRLDQERALTAQQISALEIELSKRSMELQTTRAEASSRALLTDTRLAQRDEELRICNDSLTQLREANSNLQRRCDELAQKVENQRSHELSMHASYREEIGAQTRLADLYKSMADEANSKAEEFTTSVKTLQELLEQATEQYGELETECGQQKINYEELISQKDEKIEKMTKELEQANELLKNIKQERLDQAVEQLAPTAAITSRILKKGLSLTQIYTQLMDTVNELTVEREENERLKSQMEVILRELEERAPILQQQREEYSVALSNVSTLTNQLDELLAQNNQMQESHDEAKRIAKHLTRENQKLKTELSDLARQVCFLLKEVQESRTGNTVPMNMDSSMDADLASSDLISKKLVTFKDIEELQETNQKLLAVVRSLSSRQEEIERATDDVTNGEVKEKLDRYADQIAEMQAAQERQTKMVENLMRQKDMYKTMYQQALNKTGKEIDDDEVEPMEQEEKNTCEGEVIDKHNKTVEENKDKIKELESKLADTKDKLKQTSDEYEIYKKEKAAHERMLGEEIDRLRKEAEVNSTRCCKLKVQLDSSQERFNLLQSNVATYKSQIKSLEERCANYSTTIGKHEQSIIMLKDDAMSSQTRLSRAEVQLETLKQERQLLRDSESRLLKEREMLHRERQTNALLKADVESIKASLERVQAEGQLRTEMRLDDSIRECAALRRRLQEEQDRFRELTSHLERQLATAQERLTEEQSQGERLRADLEAARTAQTEAERRADELEAKLRETITQSRAKPITGDENLAKRLQELEMQLASANAEIRSLTEQLKTARQQNQQYGDIADSTEAQLKEMTVQFEKQKRELETALEASRNAVAILEKKVANLESELSQAQSGQQVTDAELKEKLAVAEAKLEELDEVKGELELMKSDLLNASQAAKEAEEKYAREMQLHSTDLQVLAKLRADSQNISKTMDELTRAKNVAVEALEAERLACREREQQLQNDMEEMQKRIEDLDAQNSLLHNQVQELSDRTAIMQSNRSSLGGQESMDTSLDSSAMNRSLTGLEEDSKSAEQLLRVMKYLRREKDLAMTKLDVLKAENFRLKSQAEVAEKRLKESEMMLTNQREQSEIDVVTTSKHADLLRKVETLNAIADSNRILREERDSLLAKVTDLSTQVSALSEEVVPLREKARDLAGKNEAMVQENASLKNEATRWRQRANTLVERANKASPEDWRRLQTERENLSKLLTSERETHAKRMEELNALKTEKTKLEEKIAQLQKQIQSQSEQLAKATEEARQLGQDYNQALEDSAAFKKDLDQLQKELGDKEASLVDVKNKEIQIRKIAKKYKTQYEELAKTMEEEKAKAEENQTATNADVAVTEERENQLREEGREELRQQNQELTAKVEELTQQIASVQAEAVVLKEEIENMNKTSMDKEERTKQLLKGARTRIMTLTESNKKCEKELAELKMKVDSGSSDSDPNEHDARLAVIKSQFEGRITRLEHEKAEANSEKETLLQRVGQLQRQLAAGVSGVNVTEPPTANIKPMSARAETPLASIRPMSVVVQSRTAAVLPTTASNPVLVAPQQQQQVVHTTETSSPTSSHTDYQPASTSSSVSQQPSNLRQLAVQPQLSESAESTQREEPENVENMNSQQQPQQQAQQQQPCQAQQPQSQAQQPQDQQQQQQQPQTVALVSPRVEQQQQQQQQPQQTTGSEQQQTIASSSTPSVSTSQASSGHKRPRGLDTCASGSGVVEGTEHSRSEQLPSPKVKRIRTQELASTATTSGSDVEYQVPTSSQRDQDEEGEEGCIVVVDCDEGEGGSHHQAQEEEEFDNDQYEEMEEDEEEEEEEEEEEMPYGVEGEVEGDNNEVEIILEDDSRNVEVPRQAQPTIPTSQPPQQQSEAISSAGPTGEPPAFVSRSSRGIAPMPRQQQHFLLPQQGYEDGGDDSIVPSTPTLFVPRRGDGFGEAVSSPQVPQGRFTFGDSAASSTPTLATPTAANVRTMFAPSGSGVAQVVQEGMDDTRMDLTQLEDGGTGRSVPTTPLQVSPAAELPPSTSGQSEEQEAPVSGSPATGPSSDSGIETTPVPSIRVTDQETEQMEAVPGSSTATTNDGVSSESDQQTVEAAASATAGNVDDDSIDVPADEEDAEEEGREAEASPSINTRQRSIAAAAAASGTPASGTAEARGSPARRSNRTFRGAGRAGRPTPIIWDNSQGAVGQSNRGHPGGIRGGVNNEVARGRGARGRRMRPTKYGYPRY
ncbi:nucleoprotein TPR [Microplitis demolitor]|uniref:nucleoprotein TPR n=1 Tax=Microplitis demolitor TaxID=69319 RepID=UPI0004CDDB84|nr:nucleoprotein TPR [Microplitis demolitor]